MAEDLSHIRPQYHLRFDDRGVSMIWEVRALIARAAALPMIPVPLSEIAELDEPYWFDAATPATVRYVADHAGLMQAADLAWPIILCAEGRVMDGMHRVGRAYLEGRETLPARRFEVTPEPDFRGLSLADLPYD